MTSTWSPSLRLELIGDGEQSGQWGTTVNRNLNTVLEPAITGVQSIVMTNATRVLTTNNGIADEARNAVLVVTGTNTSIQQIRAPLAQKTYTVTNNTTGGFAITIGGVSGASVTIPNGATAQVYCDGTNFYAAYMPTVIAAGYGVSVNTVGVTSTITNTIFPVGTRLPFAQAAAPLGWTQDTSDNANNRMLRVVYTAGGGVGGSADPTLNNTVPYHTHGFTTGGASSDHTHIDSGHQHSFSALTSGGTGEYNPGGSGQNNPAALTTISRAALGNMTANHTHSGGTDGGSSQTNWAPRYIDLIICAKL